MASMALSMRFVQTWFSSDPRASISGRSSASSRRTSIPSGQPMPQDDERLLEPGSDVDALDRPLVEIDVALHGAHDLADAPDRQAHLVQQLVGRRAGRQPGEHLGGQLAQSRCGPPGLNERRGPVRIGGEPGHLIDAVGALERRARRVDTLRRARRVIRMRPASRPPRSPPPGGARRGRRRQRDC